LTPLRGAHPRIRWAAAPAGWAMQATRARGGWLGRAEDSAQKPNSNKKFIFFSNQFYKLQINLNSNQI
jgi:hypothetical protein